MTFLFVCIPVFFFCYFACDLFSFLVFQPFLSLSPSRVRTPPPSTYHFCVCAASLNPSSLSLSLTLPLSPLLPCLPYVALRSNQFFTLGKRGSVLTIDALVKGLSVLWKGTIEERWKVCFDLCDEESHVITYDGLLQAADLFIRIFISDVPELDIFISMVFDKAEQSHDKTLSYEYITEEIIRKPLLVEFFGIDTTRTLVHS